MEKAITITYFERMFVTLGIQHSTCKLYIDIGGLPGSTIFPRYLTNNTI